jgi:hypothetical protein
MASLLSILLEFQETEDVNNTIKRELTTFLPILQVIQQKTMLRDFTEGNECKLTVKGSNFYPLCKTKNHFANFEY